MVIGVTGFRQLRISESRQALLESFLKTVGWNASRLEALAGDASFRNYWRLRKGSQSIVLMDAPPEHENIKAFVEIASVLRGCGLSAPSIEAIDESNGFALIEDFGNRSFNSEIYHGTNAELLYKLAIDVLIELQSFSPPTQINHFDDVRILDEVSLFIHWTLPALLGRWLSKEECSQFLEVWREAGQIINRQRRSLVLFDYHADNLMWLPDRSGLCQVGLLDFQDAVVGPATYDLVSLIEDARRDVPDHLADVLISRYLDAFPSDHAAFLAEYAATAAQRNTRIIGVFGRLFLRDRKAGYLELLPRVWRLLEHDLGHPELSELRDWFDSHVPVKLRTTPDVDCFVLPK